MVRPLFLWYYTFIILPEYHLECLIVSLLMLLNYPPYSLQFTFIKKKLPETIAKEIEIENRRLRKHKNVLCRVLYFIVSSLS